MMSKQELETYTLYYRERLRTIELKKEIEKLKIELNTLQQNYQEILRSFVSGSKNTEDNSLKTK